MAELLDEGLYLGRLVEAGLDTVGDKGSSRIYLTYEITDVLEGDDWSALESPVKRDVPFWLTDKAFDGTVDTLTRMGWNGDFENPVFTTEDVLENAQLDCKHEEYDGKTRDKWDLVNYRNGFTRKEVSSKDLRALQAKLKTKRSAEKKPDAA